MGLAEDLRGASRASSTGCKVCDLFAALPPNEERAALRDALDGGPDGTMRLSAETLSSILRQHGHPVGPTTINRHRREGHKA